MTEFLIRKFVRNSENTKDPAVRMSYGKFAGKVSIICNIFLFVIKLAAGTIGSAISVSIVADAANNLSDASSGFISLMGFKLAEKPADSGHPYGHGRYEYLSGLTVSALILMIGVELFKSGIDKIFSPEERSFNTLTVIILSFSILMKIWMCIFNRSIGKRIMSETLMATGADSRNDVISTAAVLVGFILSSSIGFDLDGYVAVAVSVFIIINGIGLIKTTIEPLLGSAPDPIFVRHIEDKILSYPNVLGIHELMIHDYGPGKLFASVHVEMPSGLDIMEGHDIADMIERDFLENDRLIMTIHYDPIVTNDPLIEELNTLITESVGKIDALIKIHDLRIVPGSDHTNVIFDCVIPYGSSASEDLLRESIQKTVREKFGNFYTVIKFENSFTG